MVSRKNLGNRGEDQAVEFLKQKGFSLLERQYRHGRAEIDLIMRKDDLMIFVEVKTRTGKAYGRPEDAISQGQIERIMSSAEHYIFEQGWEGRLRFDVIAVQCYQGRVELTHLEDAF